MSDTLYFSPSIKQNCAGFSLVVFTYIDFPNQYGSIGDGMYLPPLDFLTNMIKDLINKT